MHAKFIVPELAVFDRGFVDTGGIRIILDLLLIKALRHYNPDSIKPLFRLNIRLLSQVQNTYIGLDIVPL